MSRDLILNDLHLGVKRSGGTTQASRLALEEWMFQQFESLLDIPHDRVIITGDLFDTRNVPEHIMFRVIRALQSEDSVVVLGNHDLGGINDHTYSSAEFVAALSGSVTVSVPVGFSGMYIIPHLFNQAAHEEAIANVPNDCILLTHCNVDNNFASGDHSLNLSADEMKILAEKNVRVLAAHEHIPRAVGPVTIIGNQFPSSVADCLGDVDKRCAIIEDGEISFVKTWDKSDFIEMRYDEIIPTDCKFVRITGECAVSEYPAIIRDIAGYRKKSEAFIVACSVKPLTTVQEAGEQEVDQFNIVELLMGQIPEEFKEDVKSCL
jgi:hypothetical protein